MPINFFVAESADDENTVENPHLVPPAVAEQLAKLQSREVIGILVFVRDKTQDAWGMLSVGREGPYHLVSDNQADEYPQNPNIEDIGFLIEERKGTEGSNRAGDVLITQELAQQLEGVDHPQIFAIMIRTATGAEAFISGKKGLLSKGIVSSSNAPDKSELIVELRTNAERRNHIAKIIAKLLDDAIDESEITMGNIIEGEVDFPESLLGQASFAGYDQILAARNVQGPALLRSRVAWLEDPNQLKDAIGRHFSALFREKVERRLLVHFSGIRPRINASFSMINKNREGKVMMTYKIRILLNDDYTSNPKNIH